MPELSTHLQTDDLKRRVSRRIAEMQREDLQRAGGSTDNEEDILILKKIEGVMIKPRTYDPMDFPINLMIETLHLHSVISEHEKMTLMQAVKRKKPAAYHNTPQ